MCERERERETEQVSKHKRERGVMNTVTQSFEVEENKLYTKNTDTLNTTESYNRQTMHFHVTFTLLWHAAVARKLSLSVTSKLYQAVKTLNKT